MLLRVPGIGVRSARRILRARRVGPLDFDGLKRLGAVLKRARFFLTANGRYLGEGDLAPARLRSQLLALPAPQKSRSQQLELFQTASDAADHFAATVTGEL
jgi:predicted DNA-binding helix-hairpin-helix protein